MIAHYYHTRIGGQIALAMHLIGDVEVFYDTTTEIGVTTACVDTEHIVELLLAHHPLKTPHKTPRYEAVITRQTGSEDSVDINPYDVFCTHLSTKVVNAAILCK